jgi:hypothetical protein
MPKDTAALITGGAGYIGSHTTVQPDTWTGFFHNSNFTL